MALLVERLRLSDARRRDWPSIEEAAQQLFDRFGPGLRNFDVSGRTGDQQGDLDQDRQQHVGEEFYPVRAEPTHFRARR